MGLRVVTAVVVAAVVVPTAARGVAQATAAQPKPVPFMSRYETSTRSVSRDIGISVALPDGHDLWLFGDTNIAEKTQNRWKSVGFIDGGTAAIAKPTRGRVPRGDELPNGKPTRFLPVPKDVYLPDGSRRLCTRRTAAYPARWATGAAVLPSNTSQILITYSESCVQHGGSTITPEGWGYVLYNWRTHHIVRGPIDVFKPTKKGAKLGSSQLFVTPVFDKGRLTLFSSQCNAPYGSCVEGQVWSVTMAATTAAMDNGASYKLQPLPLDLPAQWAPLSLSVNRYPTGLRLFQMTSLWGTYKIFSAPRVGGPWHLLRSGTLPGCPSHKGFCWSVQGHPELSTTSRIYVSYSNPDYAPGGHVMVIPVPD